MKFRQYKYWFLLIVLWSILFAYLFFFIYDTTKTKAINELNARQKIFADQAARSLESYFAHWTSLMTSLSQEKHMAIFDDQGRKEMEIVFSHNQHELKAITRIDHNGSIMYTLPYHSTLVGRDVSYQKHHQKMLMTHRPVISDVFRAVQGYEAIALLVPVFLDGEFKGSIGVLLDFRVISKRYLENIVIGQTGYAWVLSGEGIELFCPVPGHVGKSVFDNCRDFPTIITMAKEMLLGREGVTTYVYDRIREHTKESFVKQAVYRPIRILDSFWSIVVSSSEEEALEYLEDFKKRLLLIIGLALLGTVFISYWGIRAWTIVKEEDKRRVLENALRESEARFREIVEGTQAGYFHLDREGRFQKVNRAWLQMHGYASEDEVVGRHFSMAQIDVDLEAAQQIVEQLLGGATIPVGEFTRRCKDGSIGYHMFSVRPVVQSGKVVGLEGFLIDTTAYRQAEEKYQTLFREMLDGFALHQIICDSSGAPVDYRFLAVNPACEKLTGLKADDIIGRTVTEVLPDIERHWIEIYGRVALTGEPAYFVNYAQDLQKHYEVRAFRPAPNQFACIFTDVSARKQGEIEKEKLQSQLQQAHKMEAIGTLAGGISHDFNNLLQAINGFTELLLMNKTASDPDYRSLKTIQNAGNRAAELVRQLLLFSRKAETEKKPVDINQEVAHTRKMLERTIPKMVGIEVHMGSRLWTVKADPVQIQQILLNLGTNAADAMAEGGKLIIETQNVILDEEYARTHLGSRPGRYVLLSVSDTGLGMDKETLGKIFQPFFTTKEIGKGTGLGLASVYGIVKSHHGYIMCYSEIAQGTTFKIYLPAMEQACDDVGESSSEPLRGGTETILLVDDEETITDFAKQLLIKFGYSVLTAASGEEALAVYSRQSSEIDLVIMDLGMPGMGGYKCLQELVRLYPKIKVLIASGYSINGQIHKSLEAGAAGFVGKPYQLTDLLHKVRAVLDN